MKCSLMLSIIFDKFLYIHNTPSCSRKKEGEYMNINWIYIRCLSLSVNKMNLICTFLKDKKEGDRIVKEG